MIPFRRSLSGLDCLQDGCDVFWGTKCGVEDAGKLKWSGRIGVWIKTTELMRKGGGLKLVRIMDITWADLCSYLMKLEYLGRRGGFLYHHEMVKPEGLGEYLPHSQLSITGHRMSPKTLEHVHLFMSVPEADQQSLKFGSLCTNYCGMKSCAFWYFYFKVCTEMLGRLFRWQKRETRKLLRRQPSSESSFAHPAILRHRELGTGQEKWISLTRNCSKPAEEQEKNAATG